jgi:hypothetical protein
MTAVWTGKILRRVFSALLVALMSVGAAGCTGGQDDGVDTKVEAITGNWTPLTLLTGWSNYWGSTYPPAVGIVNGTVTFRGAIKANSTANAIPFSLGGSAYTAFQATDGNAISVPTVMWQPGVGDVVGSVLFKGNILGSGYNTAVYQDPNPGNDNTVGPGAQYFTSLEGVAYDATVGVGIPVNVNGNWNSEYTRRQDVYGATCSSGNCGVWVKSVNGFIRFQGFLSAIDQNPMDFNGYLFTLTDSTYIPGQEVQVPVDLGNGKAWGALTIDPNGAVYVNGDITAADSGVSFENAWFSKTNTGNVALPLSHGWQAYSPRQVKVGNYGGVVRLQGAIYGGTSTTIGTLASTYRPTVQVRMAAVANGAIPAFVVIDTAGNITVEGVPLNVAALYLSLDGLSYGL